MKKVVLFVLVLVVLLLIVDLVNPTYGFFKKVDTGHVGVVTVFGKVNEDTLPAGFHVTGWFSRVTQMDVRTQRRQVQLTAFSSDIQQVSTALTVNYNVMQTEASRLYRDVGLGFEDSLILPRILENAKIVISNYTAEALIENRENLSSEILALMQADLERYGIQVTGVSLENIDFTDAFEAAVEAKQVATQNKLTAQTEQQRLTMEAQAQAERQKIEAETAAEVRRINADAEAYAIKTKADAEADANEKVAATVTDALIRYTEAQQWNGELPDTYIGDGSGAIPVIQTGETGN